MKALFTMIKIITTCILLGIFGCSTQSLPEQRETDARIDQLPYYNEASFTPNWFDSVESIPENFHQIPAFNLYNQFGENITEQSVEGKVLVVDFFFTSCPGICPKMTANLAVVQEAFLSDDKIRLLSHSVTPEFDDVEILKEYADKKGIVGEKWHLLTGDRDHIYDLGRNQYFIEEDQGLKKDPEDFIHTENFVLVDEHRYIRGIYNGLNKTSVSQLIADIKALKKGES